MQHLAQLTPAETHLLLETSKVELKDLMKYTFMDLVLKQAIQTREVQMQAHPKAPIRNLTYVIKGGRFESYSFRPHEQIFLSPFTKADSIKILLRHIVKMGLENSEGKRKYIHDSLLQTSTSKNLYHQNSFSKLFGRIKLNQAGVTHQNAIKQEVQELEGTLPEILKNDQAKALEIIHTINGNIFLLKGLDIKLLKNIDSQLIRELEKKNKKQGVGCYGCGCWYAFDNYSDSFDRDYNYADDHSGGWFDSDDSGCSGCNGCGGCGGCS